MSESRIPLDHAVIKYDGANRESDGYDDLYKVEAAKFTFWFQVAYRFVENGNDFRLQISNFGLSNRSFAGPTNPLALYPFTAADAETVRQKLEALFLGPIENPSLSVFFRVGGGRCLGVDCPEGWIRLA